jgi:hypothetical protein
MECACDINSLLLGWVFWAVGCGIFLALLLAPYTREV